MSSGPGSPNKDLPAQLPHLEVIGNNTEDKTRPVGGIAFDHGVFPRIVSVHSWDRRKNNPPWRNEPMPSGTLAMHNSLYRDSLFENVRTPDAMQERSHLHGFSRNGMPFVTQAMQNNAGIAYHKGTPQDALAKQTMPMQNYLRGLHVTGTRQNLQKRKGEKGVPPNAFPVQAMEFGDERMSQDTYSMQRQNDSLNYYEKENPPVPFKVQRMQFSRDSGLHQEAFAVMPMQNNAFGLQQRAVPPEALQENNYFRLEAKDDYNLQAMKATQREINAASFCDAPVLQDALPIQKMLDQNVFNDSHGRDTYPYAGVMQKSEDRALLPAGRWKTSNLRGFYQAPIPGFNPFRNTFPFTLPKQALAVNRTQEMQMRPTMIDLNSKQYHSPIHKLKTDSVSEQSPRKAPIDLVSMLQSKTDTYHNSSPASSEKHSTQSDCQSKSENQSSNTPFDEMQHRTDISRTAITLPCEEHTQQHISYNKSSPSDSRNIFPSSTETNWSTKLPKPLDPASPRVAIPDQSNPFTIDHHAPKSFPAASNRNSATMQSALDAQPTKYDSDKQIGRELRPQDYYPKDYYPRSGVLNTSSGNSTSTAGLMKEGLANVAMIHNAVNKVFYPYDQYPESGMFSHQAPPTATKALPYPEHIPVPNLDGSYETATKYSTHGSGVKSNFAGKRSRQRKEDTSRAKPYDRPKVSPVLLKLENRCNLLYVLKAGADKGRHQILDIVAKLIKHNFVDSSMCLLETLKTSDLTEITKERVLSAIEEIIWHTEPRRDLWSEKPRVSPNSNQETFTSQGNSVRISDFETEVTSSMSPGCEAIHSNEVNSDHQVMNECLRPKRQFEENESSSLSLVTSSQLPISTDNEESCLDFSAETFEDLGEGMEVSSSRKDEEVSISLVHAQTGNHPESTSFPDKTLPENGNKQNRITPYSNPVDANSKYDSYTENGSSFPVLSDSSPAISNTMTLRGETEVKIEPGIAKLRECKVFVEKISFDLRPGSISCGNSLDENCLLEQNDFYELKREMEKEVKEEALDIEDSCLFKRSMKRDESYQSTNHVVRNFRDIVT